MEKRAIIFLNNQLTDIEKIKKLIKKSDLLIAVNGGSKLLKELKLAPDVLIGDLDSLNSKLRQELVIKGVQVIKFSKEKDFTDSELGIKHAVDKGCREIVLTGFLGNRLDHMLANLMILVKWCKKGVKVSMVEGNQMLYLIKDKLDIIGKKGDLVSLVAIDGDCEGVTVEGLKYNLQRQSLQVGVGKGVSNVMLGKKAKVGLKKGVLLVVVTNFVLQGRTLKGGK